MLFRYASYVTKKFPDPLTRKVTEAPDTSKDLTVLPAISKRESATTQTAGGTNNQVNSSNITQPQNDGAALKKASITDRFTKELYLCNYLHVQLFYATANFVKLLSKIYAPGKP